MHDLCNGNFSTTKSDGERLTASGFGGDCFESTFFDARVFDPQVPSNKHAPRPLYA